MLSISLSIGLEYNPITLRRDYYFTLPIYITYDRLYFFIGIGLFDGLFQSTFSTPVLHLL